MNGRDDAHARHIEYGDIGTIAVERIQLMRLWHIEDGVGIFTADLHLLLDGQAIECKHGDIVAATVAGEAQIQGRCEIDAVHALGAGNGADALMGSQVDHLHLVAVRDIQPLMVGVDAGIVPFAIAAQGDAVMDGIFSASCHAAWRDKVAQQQGKQGGVTFGVVHVVVRKGG